MTRLAREVRSGRAGTGPAHRLARQLLVNGVPYTRRVWADSQAESDEHRTAGSPPKGLLGDPRVQDLVDDRLTWSFSNWAQLSDALGAWTPGQPVPSSLRDAHCALPRGHPARLMTLDEMLPRSGPTDAIGRSLAEFRKALLTMEDADPLIAEAAALQLTSTCGLFAGTLVDAVASAQDEALPLLFQRTFCGQYDAAALEEAIVSISRGRPLLLHVILPSLHEFVIEKAPGGAAHLYQAWVSAFNGVWWCGLEAGMLPKLLPGGHRVEAQMSAKRGALGRGADINLTALAYGLGDLLRADVFGDPAADVAWRRLPFIPDAVRGLHLSDAPTRENVIKAEIRIYEVAAPRVVARVLGGDEGMPLGMRVAAWLSGKMALILKAADDALRRHAVAASSSTSTPGHSAPAAAASPVVDLGQLLAARGRLRSGLGIDLTK